VEAHVLRYWEEELEIEVPRNEMGHRYYTDNHINILKKVKELKDCGYGLKAIKMVINDPEKSISQIAVRDSVNSKNQIKMQQFQSIMNEIVVNAIKEAGKELTASLSDDVSSNVIKEMDYLLRVKEEREEERFKMLDETIRNRQKKCKEIAATKEKKKFFGLKKRNCTKT
ncbi:MAG: helix-turn-helix domain-containing protein, partial [Eubacterium sp.]